MNWSKIKKILICIMLMLVVSAMLGNVYADINSTYYDSNKGAFKVSDTKENLVLKVIASVLLDAIGSLVYALANLGEWLLGIIFQAVSGGDEANNIFPWADAIVFNAIPFLDVNFINPYSGGGTVVGLIQDVIKSIYGTIFGLAISFFSIAVLIMGIKIAVSTIAAEKAKYKQAIWDWILGLILLFTIHFFISFVFYLNEQLVNKASEEAAKAFSGTEAQAVIDSLTKNPKADVAVDNFIDAMESMNIVDVLHFGLNRMMDGIDGSSLPSLEDAKQIIRDNPEISVALLESEGYRHYRFGDRDTWYIIDTTSSDKFWSWGKGDKDLIRVLAQDVEDVVDGGPGVWAKNAIDTLSGKPDKNDKEERLLKYAQIMVDTYNVHIKGEGAASSHSLLANLAQYFKKTAWSVGNNSWKTDKIVIQNAIMYAILVVQSFIFLIAYIKRLFYVIILAMMAPAVVVYDFFNKSIS